MKYIVEITETLVKHVIVEASSDGDAEIIANDAYNNEDIVLDADDYVDAEFRTLRQANKDDINEYAEVSVK